MFLESYQNVKHCLNCSYYYNILNFCWAVNLTLTYSITGMLPFVFMLTIFSVMFNEVPEID